MTPPTSPRRRSNAPIFWLLFGAGGMLSALLGPALAAVTGVAAPLGLGLPADALSYARMLGFAQSLIGKLALEAVIALFAWHAAHRLLCTLHDFGIHKGLGAKLLFYGTAALISTVTAVNLLAIG